MSDHPVIFSAAMIQALLAGRKTMTRRLAWGNICPRCNGRTNVLDREKHPTHPTACPRCSGAGHARSLWQRVKPGDRLWVRENLYADRMANFLTGERTTEAICAYYIADDEECLEQKGFNLSWTWKGKTLPSIHMPRMFSRLTLIVTTTKIERLQDIGAIDAIAEGLIRVPLEDRLDVQYQWQPYPCGTSYPDPVQAFAMLWTTVHDAEAWRANPEVVALTFAVHKQNIDSMKEAA